MTAKNETLEYRAEQNNIIGQVRELPSGKVLPSPLQNVFNGLDRAFYEPDYEDEYKDAVKANKYSNEELGKKVNWVMKTKLTND